MRYADDYRGWPVAPRTKQHPVRGSFLDPRVNHNYHNGVDVSVRDDQPESGAPAGRSHRVYALEGGEVWRVIKPKKAGQEGIVRIGHFGYGHVDPVVALGDKVRPGQMIGWTFTGEWHVHITEWRFPTADRFKGVPVNPLERAGKIHPYVDTAPPAIREIRFMTPALSESPWTTSLGRAVFPASGFPVDPKRLRSLVDVRVRIEDPQSFRGWFRQVPILESRHHPTRVRVKVVRLANGQKVVERDVFRADKVLGAGNTALVPLERHYAPGAKQNLKASTTMKRQSSGRGEYWFRLFASPVGAFWDTTLLANGGYRITITAWDVAGNLASGSVDVTIRN